MTGIETDAQFTSGFRSFDKRGDSRFRVLRIIRSIRFRIKLHTVGTSLCRIFHHFRIGGNKNGCTNTRTVELVENFRQKFQICFCIPA